MEYYLVLKEILVHVTEWMNLQSDMLCDINQMQKDMCYVLYDFICIRYLPQPNS